MRKTGFTMIEIMFVITIMATVGIMAGKFQKNIFSSNTYIKNGLKYESEARILLRGFIAEIRSALPSATGAHMVESAGAGSFIFYSDINGDGNTERVRYFLDGTNLKKGIVVPTDDPLSYNMNTEILMTIASNVISSPVFNYYGADNEALFQPVDSGLVRLVKITLKEDMDGVGPVLPFSVSSQATLRNLKE